MGGAVKSVFGGGDSVSSAKPMGGAMFQPFTYTTLAGTAKGKKGEDGQYIFSQEVSPELQSLYGVGLGAAEPLLSQYLAQAQVPVDRFAFDKGIQEATQEYFTQQQAALEPAFEQQRQQLQSGLFGSGRMGLMLAGETAGAGAGGMVSPDAFGLGKAQSAALQEAYARSRQAALGEQAQAFDIAKQQYSLNQLAQQQQLANLLAGYGGAFGTARDVLGIESGLIGQGAGLEQMVRSAAAGAASAGAGLQAAGTRSGGGLFGGLVSGLGSAIASPVGGAIGGKIAGFF